jgi:PPOX class probable F420-dependent enzyme
MLPWSWAVERLEASRSYWIATTRDDGSPHAAPVWGLWLADGLWFSTSPQSRKGRNLVRDPRATVHLESGDEVVVLEGEVERVTLDDSTAGAYEAKYAIRPDPADESGLWLRLRPQVAYAWQERDYPRTATRFAFA